MDARRLFEAIDRGDVRMVERGQHLRFAPESRQPVRLGREGVGQDLQRHVAVESEIPRAIHLAIPPSPICAMTS